MYGTEVISFPPVKGESTAEIACERKSGSGAECQRKTGFSSHWMSLNAFMPSETAGQVCVRSALRVSTGRE